METFGNHPEQVAENFWFVLVAYFLVTAAWYAVSGNIFISSRWITAAETRKRGQRNLLALSVAMPYLVVYFYFQAKSGDYKEACLAFVAFFVTILHMLRTVLSLWQLHVFKHWVIRSIRSMESLGYRIEAPGVENGRSTHRGTSSAAAQKQERDRTHFDADNIIVNDTIVGNKLSEGGAHCYLLYFTPNQKSSISRAGSLPMRALLTLRYAVESIACLGGIVWSLLFSRSPLCSKHDSTPFLKPREPEELWLRWASVLISRAFPNWVSGMRKSCSEESIIQASEYQVHRDRFAEDVLCSAALHCETDTTETSSGSSLPFHLWRKFPKLSRGTFCKQAFLKHACTTGNGLPFQSPHRHAASRREERLFYSYAKYRLKLEEARDSLPANEGESVTDLSTEELEWLSIFLSIEDWNLSNSQSPQSDTRGIAIENLCNQLGFPGKVKGFSERFASPFLKGKERVTLWGNRNVLTLSAHVDNWLALLAGEQEANIMQQVPGMEEGFLFRNSKTKDSENQTQELVESIAEESIFLEKQRLMFQLSAADPEFSHFEQSLTFLGCSMENLRSSMAKWVERNPEEQSGAWTPTFGSSRGSSDTVNGGKFEFHASKDFDLCLSEVSTLSCWSQRYLQMRLLWELQNNLHNTLSERGISPNQSEAILLCILSFPAIRVMASEIDQTQESTVSVQRNRDFCCITIDEKLRTFRIEHCKLTLRASYGPQNVHIKVLFARQVNESGIVVTAQLCGDGFEEGKQFVWEAWRDVFHRSLQSTRQWQVEHQIANSSLSVCPYIHSIGAGIGEIETANSRIGPAMKLWKGWPPHKEMLSKYEMMTEGLILEPYKATVIPEKTRIVQGKRSTFVPRPRIEYVPVSYEEATCQYLTRATQIAEDFLRKAAGCSSEETVDESSKKHRKLEMIRYEISATKAGDDIALDKVMKMLISGNPNREEIERAVELFEECFTAEATKARSVRILESLSRPIRNKNWVQKIKDHYKALMAVTSFGATAAISFACFCSTVPSHHKQMLDEEGSRTVAISILRTTYSGNILLTFELTKSLEMLLDIGNEEWYYLACSMGINNIEKATKILSKTRNEIALTNTKHLPRNFMSFKTFDGSCGEENIPLLSDFISELEKRKEDAQDRLGELFMLRTYYAGDYVSRAAKLYSQAADDGDLVATYHRAFLIQFSARPNPSKEMVLYTRAMKGGIDAALCPLAQLYAGGHSRRTNTQLAVKLYTRAIENRGDIRAMYWLAGLLYKGAEGVPADPPRAFQLLSRAVEEGGDVDSMNFLAFVLQTGAEGVPKDAPYAVRLYERAIKEGADHRAKNNLAQLLASGVDGVPVNLKRAIALYESAVDEGDNTYSMVQLGELFLKGTGVPADAFRAAQLFQRAIDKDGKKGALVQLADMLIEGAIGVPQDPIRALQLYTRAIEEHGCGDAMYELARVLEFGKNGVPADSARAFSLYTRAASEKKHSKAARRLRKVEKQKEVLEQVQHIWSK